MEKFVAFSNVLVFLAFWSILQPNYQTNATRRADFDSNQFEHHRNRKT